MKIQINNLSKSFEDKIIFENYTNELNVDNILIVKGKSGLGKTTLLRIIAGLDKDYTGKILMDNCNVSFMFQEDRLIPFISVIKNLTTVSTKETALHYLKLLGLENEQNNAPSSLSGGMKRRVALARALCFDSQLVILDEPFKGLDDKLKNNVCEIIKKESQSRCFLVVSHDSEDVELLNAKILELDA